MVGKWSVSTVVSKWLVKSDLHSLMKQLKQLQGKPGFDPMNMILMRYCSTN